uniref:Ig-like domain-containing protein n=1 Tax=Knipowitschia caucasica TaxID=637954 RepID=A0AAV2K1Y7_KNICA
MVKRNAPPEVSSWVEWRGGRRVAVCRAEGASPAANVSWLITGNATTKTSESDGLITMETTVELPTPEQAQNISCTVTHPYWDEPHVIRPDFSPRQAMSQNRTAVYATIAISVVFCLAMLVLGIKKVTHLRMNQNSSKSPSVEEVEEVEPYESYVQRVNSIYNSSRDLFA